MTASDKHADLTSNLIRVLKEFHEKNPDLFALAVEIDSRKNVFGNRIMAGLTVTVVVQPSKT